MQCKKQNHKPSCLGRSWWYGRQKDQWRRKMCCRSLSSSQTGPCPSRWCRCTSQLQSHKKQEPGRGRGGWKCRRWKYRQTCQHLDVLQTQPCRQEADMKKNLNFAWINVLMKAHTSSCSLCRCFSMWMTTHIQFHVAIFCRQNGKMFRGGKQTDFLTRAIFACRRRYTIVLAMTWESFHYLPFSNGVFTCFLGTLRKTNFTNRSIGSCLFSCKIINKWKWS